jgi:hypothetical protein
MEQAAIKLEAAVQANQAWKKDQSEEEGKISPGPLLIPFPSLEFSPEEKASYVRLIDAMTPLQLIRNGHDEVEIFQITGFILPKPWSFKVQMNAWTLEVSLTEGFRNLVGRVAKYAVPVIGAALGWYLFS